VYRFLEPLEDGDIIAYVERARGNLGPLREQRSEFPPLFNALWTRFDASLKLNAGSVVYLLPAPADSLGGAVRFDGRRDVVLLGSEVMTFIQDAGE
jgi:hypothetical protein